MTRYLAFIIVILLASRAYANCDFKSGEYINELRDPSLIERIEIKTPKSGKYAKNFFRIVESDSDVIPQKLKKRYKASIIIHYSFGQCFYQGRVRQNGFLKDHIGFTDGGKPIRSLDVRLDSGNIMSAVRFKLLIPNTRNGENEVLAALILKKLGIISPETFYVDTEVNGVPSIMLFQENARKELIEKNARRENAIFEGDTELLWSYKDSEDYELEPLALAKMVNDNWFRKGPSSQEIALSAFSRIQASYLQYANNTKDNLGLLIYPNDRKTSQFSDYAFVLLAMNGGKALRPFNRKYYYNVLTADFEPIYYDGNVSFGELSNDVLGSPLIDVVKRQFTSPVSPEFIAAIKNVANSEKLKSDFIKRAQNSGIDAEDFFQNAIAQFNSNIDQLSNMIIDSAEQQKNDGEAPIYANYLERMSETKLSQAVIRELEKNPDGYEAELEDDGDKDLSIKQVARLISRNRIKKERAIFLGNNERSQRIVTKPITNDNFKGELFIAPGIDMSVDPAEKIITFNQSTHNDWVFIKNAELKGWRIRFNGIEEISEADLLAVQRFNEFGLSGCLTIYNSTLDNTSINIVGGACEDSLSLVSSQGSLDAVFIDGAYADAIDIDFSTLTFDEVVIDDAGNDCLDVSGGDYKVNSLKLQNCGDKGVSIGEVSKFMAKDTKMSEAEIGISVKDYSQAEFLQTRMDIVPLCIEVIQKKQEFGGGFLKLGEIECKGLYSFDKNSTYKKDLN